MNLTETAMPPPTPAGRGLGAGCVAGAASARRWTGWWPTCGRAEPGPGPARRGGGRQDRAAGLPGRARGRAAAIARAAGVESEMELAFAGLHQLCAPLLDRLERLPGPQRDALGTAFGLRDGTAPDRFLVGLAVLEPAGRRSRGAAAGLRGRRRAVAGPGLGAGAGVRGPPAAGRAGRAGLRGARAQRRAGAGRAAGAAWSAGWATATRARCWTRSSPGRWIERVRDRIVAETRGNPLALLELPRGLTPGGAGGRVRAARRAAAGEPDRGELPATARSRCRRADAAAAAGRRGRADRRRRRCCGGRPSGSASAPTAAAPASAAGLIELGAQVRFRHPLVRSAVYRAASPRQRQRVHRALADATDPDVDPDRRAWHRAHAAPGPDEDGRRRAGALGRPGAGPRRPGRRGRVPRAGRRADARPGTAGAAGAGRGAGQVPGRRARGGAAAAGHGAGRTARRARARPGGAAARPARVRRRPRPRRAAAAARGGQAARAARRRAGARDLPGRARARRCSPAAWQPAAACCEVAEAARGAPRAPQPPRAADLLLDGLARAVTEGYAAGAPMLRRALSAFATQESPGRGGLGWLLLACRMSRDALGRRQLGTRCRPGWSS